jgi:hypothetical protein
MSPGKTGASMNKRRKSSAKKSAVVIWEVEELLDCRQREDIERFEFLVKWKDWDGENTWEPEENLLRGAMDEAENLKKRYYERVSPHRSVGDRIDPTPVEKKRKTASIEGVGDRIDPRPVEKKRKTASSQGMGDVPKPAEKKHKTASSQGVGDRVKKQTARKSTVTTASTKLLETKLEKPPGQEMKMAAAKDQSSMGVQEMKMAATKEASSMGVQEMKKVATKEESLMGVQEMKMAANSIPTTEVVHGFSTSDKKSTSDPKTSVRPMLTALTKPAPAGKVGEGKEPRRLISIWKLIEKDLRDKLSAGHPKVVEALSKLYPESAFPALKPTLHCVFCHKLYDPRFPDQCEQLHTLTVDALPEVAPDCFLAKCVKCGESWEASQCYIETLTAATCFEYPTHCVDIKQRLAKLFDHDVERRRFGSSPDPEPFDGCKHCSIEVERAKA